MLPVRIYRYHSCFHSQLSFTSSGAGSRWPEPNGLLALPTQNQTLCCERVPRQETIMRIFGIGATELRVWDPSSPAQLPLQSCVDSKLSDSFQVETTPLWLE